MCCPLLIIGVCGLLVLVDGCQLLVVRHLLRVVCYADSLCVVGCVLFVDWCLLFVVNCMLFVCRGCCSPLAAGCCLSRVARCSLFVVRCLLFNVFVGC